MSGTKLEEESEGNLSHLAKIESQDSIVSDVVDEMGVKSSPSVPSKPVLTVLQPGPEFAPFMQLPLEIRTMIYKELLIMPSPIEFRSSYYLSAEPACFTTGPLDCEIPIYQKDLCQMFNASKTIRLESAPLYFRYNRFRFQTLRVLEKFLNQIPPTFRRAIASISLKYDYGAAARTMRLLSGCFGLRRLCIVLLPGHMFPSPPYSMHGLMHIQGLNDMLKIRGLEKVEVQVKPWCTGAIIDTVWEDMPEFEKALEVLKEPHTKAQLARQDKKDFPQKASRQVFGKANVVTRAERKLLDSQASADA